MDTDGNEILTGMVAAVLLVLLAALGVTIVRIGQLTWLHLFLGLLLIGPVLLKLGSTGYRFVRYYTGSRAYRLKGPPPPAMRVIAPMVVVSTLVVLVSGVLLLVDGPGTRDQYLTIHKVSFFVWLAVTALHVLGHVVGLPQTWRRALPDGRSSEPRSAALAGRWLTLAGAIVAGLVVALALLPDFAAWTAHGLHHGG